MQRHFGEFVAALPVLALAGLAREDLAAILIYDKISITDQERGDIAALAWQMGMDLGSSWSSPAQKP
jgi:hypothetical protein